MMPLTDRRLGIVTHRVTGFTIIELLVVTTIIGILIALLLPAVQAAREASRRLQCGNNVKQLALAALAHESALQFFPTGGWERSWLGHPDRGFGKRQPGGWIYNTLPFIEQQALHDLGTTGSGMTIEDANAQRAVTPLAGLNCPSRRPAAPYRFAYELTMNKFTFRLTSGPITQLARSDYAMNGGDYVDWRNDARSPESLASADSRLESDWEKMSHQTGLSYQRSQVTMSDIKDGASNTLLIGEKYVNSNHYADGCDLGDNDSMYSGDDLDLLRWTGTVGKAGNLPMQDRSTSKWEGNHVQWFGSAHAGAFNMSFCDGSVRSIGYSIEGEVYRRFGNRMDLEPVDGSMF